MVFLALGILLVSLIIGVPVPFAFLASAFFFIVTGEYKTSFMIPYGISKLSTTVLFAIPLFIMAGGIMEKGNIGGKLIGLVENFVGKIKGGLGVVAVVSCAVFGSITGSACATLSCIGSIMFPRLERAGYPRGHSAALLANSAVLGMLIPPSSLMILYAWVGGQSVLACFLSSVIPGIILTTLLSIVNVYLLRDDPNIQVTSGEQDFDGKRGLDKFIDAFPALLMPVIVLGGIYAGIMTPTEAAAVSVLYAIPVGMFIYKGLTLKGLWDSLVDSAMTTGVIMVMLYCVMILGRIYVMEGLPTKILALLKSISDSKLVILFILNIFMIIMGMLMDDVSSTLLSTPLLLPIAIEIGVHPVHFAAIVGVNLGMGNITPPCAPLLYLGGSLGKAPVGEMLYPTLVMFVFAWIPTLILTTYMPSLSLWLPRLVLGIN
ncbi:MAG TPA: TRAP transporter large permease [Synergistaceae bacterium]|nr:TRAP transporter large permease [Synergistaceae bacterium]